MTENKTICLYGCGGLGTNICKAFESNRNKSNPGFAAMHSYYIDTSDSNLEPSSFNEDSVYIIEPSDDPNGPQGSGKKRDSNHKAIADRINDVLLRFKPSATLNVVIHSTSGGSGSVIGPLLVKELLKRSQPVIVMIVGSHTSKIEAQNSIKTLESYENIANIEGKPVSAFYLENGNGNSRTDVDNKIQLGLLITSLLFSGTIKELDDSDLRNFLDYTKVTSFSPRLTYLRPIEGKIKLNKEETIISAVTVTDSQVSPELEYPVEYQATGYIRDEYIENLKNCEKPLHLINVNSAFHSIVNGLKMKLKEYESARSASIDKSIVTEVDESNGGLVF